ncbi:MAG TPA: phosphoglucomutase/phosphomannomutase family protein [Dehalococcoidia bacterium]|nr:phosphoglucomutase/phosphomannomutase family protein [Dehalococcoidia bacterium]
MRLTKNPIKFGTDGWRAVIAEDFTFENVRFCAQGVADYLKQEKLDGQGLVIGYDNRFASEDFAVAAAEVIAGNGIKVFLTTRAEPTPVISYGVIVKKAAGAIAITASHNPAQWNGFKLRITDSSSDPREVTDKVEKLTDRAFNAGTINRIPLDVAQKKKLVEYIDLHPVFLERATKFVDLEELRQARLKVIIDAMYGAGAGYLKTLLAGGNIDVTEINGERNPAFPGINPEPIAVNLSKLSTAVREQKANVGIAHDGDADRIGIIDENGEFLTQLQVFALLCLYFLETREERGPIVKTINSTSMINRLGEIYNVPVYETAIGFLNHVAPVMVTENALIGGEESGGYGFRGHILERDSVAASLYFLDFMVKTGKTPAQLLEYLFSKVGPHYYHRKDIHFAEEERERVLKHMREISPETIDGVGVVKKDTTDGFRFILEDNTWLLIRFSGTEPVLRIYAESDSMARVERLLELGKELAGVSI